MPFTNLHWFQKTNKELSEVYLTLYLRKFAISLINIFIPIYLYKIGYTLNQVIYFVITWFLFQAIGGYIASKTSYKIGTKHTIVISVPLLILFFLFLYEAPKLGNFIYLIAPLIGLSNGFYWVPTNAVFAKNSHKKSPGKETSYLMISSRLAGVLAPLIGGIIISNLKFHHLLSIVIALLFLSLIPLFLSKDYACKKKDMWLKLLKNNIRYFIGYFFQGAIVISTFLLIPFLMLSLTNSYVSIGLVSTILLVGSFAVILIVGKLTDKFEGKKLIKLGGAIVSAAFLILSYSKNVNVIYLTTFIIGISTIMIYLPLFAISSIVSKKYNETEFMMLREFALCAGRIFMLILLLALPAFKIKIGFMIAALSSLYFVLFKIRTSVNI
ncbi:MAG: MFS transporter [Nanoarchaeota archaeon]|nr:MFS transporter [Nanoarchaeota archaeon]